MKKIIINEKLKFSFDDLTQYVDTSKSFTLKDVLNCIRNSKVSLNVLRKILKCRCLEEYIDEVNQKKSVGEDDGNKLYYLQVQRAKNIEKVNGKKESSCRWEFYGVGKMDKLTAEKYAIEFSPLYGMADLKVKVSNVMVVWDETNTKFYKEKIEPLIMLVELLYAVVYEISWNGSIKNREAKLAELKRRVEDIKEDKPKK